MNTAIILHGMPSKKEYYSPTTTSPSNTHWLPWLQNKLLQNGILTQTPEMPEPFMPDYQKWHDTISGYTMDEDTILVGHSCGAGFLLKYLSETQKPFKHLFLVAPWIDPTNELKNNFFENIFQNKIDGGKVTVIYSTDDFSEILKSIDEIKANYPESKYITFHDKKHFCFNDLGTVEFPELLEEVLL